MLVLIIADVALLVPERVKQNAERQCDGQG